MSPCVSHWFGPTVILCVSPRLLVPNQPNRMLAIGEEPLTANLLVHWHVYPGDVRQLTLVMLADSLWCDTGNLVKFAT